MKCNTHIIPSFPVFDLRFSLALSAATHLFIFGLFFLPVLTVNVKEKEPIFIVELKDLNPPDLSVPAGKLRTKGKIAQSHPTPRLAAEAPLVQGLSKEAESSPVVTAEEAKEDLPTGPAMVFPARDNAASTEAGMGASTTLSGRGDAKSNASGAGHSEKLVEMRFGDFEAPFFLHRVVPVYPPLAQRMGKEGKVVLSLNIDHTGKLMGVEVVEGADYGFTEAAVNAVKRSTFAPARRNGLPVSSRAVLVVRFQLQ